MTKSWNFVIVWAEWRRTMFFSNLIRGHWPVVPPISGSTVIIVVPLHTIEAQLVSKCGRLGIPAMAGSQVNLKCFSEMAKIWFSQISSRDFEAAMAWRPKLLVCSFEYLADSQVGCGWPNVMPDCQFYSGAKHNSEASANACDIAQLCTITWTMSNSC